MRGLEKDVGKGRHKHEKNIKKDPYPKAKVKVLNDKNIKIFDLSAIRGFLQSITACLTDKQFFSETVLKKGSHLGKKASLAIRNCSLIMF